MSNPVVSRAGVHPPAEVTNKIDDFLESFLPYEMESGGKLHLFLDEKSDAYYLSLHLTGSVLAQSSDSNAALDADEEEDEIYKLNRDILETSRLTR